MKFFTAVALFGAASALKLRSQQTAEEILSGAGDLLEALDLDAGVVFDAVDADGNGSLTSDEVLDAVRSEEAAAAFEAAMASDEVSEEIKGALKWIKKQMEDETITDEQRKEWLGKKFGHLDTDEVEGLSKEELGIDSDSETDSESSDEEETLAQTNQTGDEIIQEGAELFGSLGLTEEDAVELFNAIDGDDNGQLTGEEVLEAAKSDKAKKAFKKIMESDDVSDEHKGALKWAADQLATASDEDILGWFDEKFGHLDTDQVEGLSLEEIGSVLAQVGEVDLEGISAEDLLEGAVELAEAMDWDLGELYDAVDTDGVEGISADEAVDALRSDWAKLGLEAALASDDVDEDTKAYLGAIADWVAGSTDEELKKGLGEKFGRLDGDEDGQLSWEEMEDALDE